jgi:dTDP-4-dehydrorhamnose 3,5-epimerase-like enzyme
LDEIAFDEVKPTPIDGLTVARKRVFADQRGAVMHMLKGDQFSFPVGEIYFSLVHSGQIKGWKCHKEMWQRFTVPVGSITFVFVDKRPNGHTSGKTFVHTLS